MNSEQLKMLRDAAKQAENERNWDSSNRFMALASPQNILALCDELLALRAGNSKMPSSIPSKKALEVLLNAEPVVPSCDKVKNGYSIRYSGFSFDPNKSGPHADMLWTEQERYVHRIREQGQLHELIHTLEEQAHIPTWQLTVEVGKRKGYEGTIIFRYIREDHANQQQLSLIDL